MFYLGDLFNEANYVNWVAGLTYLSILILLGYILYSLGVFKRR
jgi:hypothetical protein